jgi:hypothetical protein
LGIGVFTKTTALFDRLSADFFLGRVFKFALVERPTTTTATTT